jgi:hypothetical protein
MPSLSPSVCGDLHTYMYIYTYIYVYIYIYIYVHTYGMRRAARAPTAQAERHHGTQDAAKRREFELCAAGMYRRRRARTVCRVGALARCRMHGGRWCGPGTTGTARGYGPGIRDAVMP